MKPERQSGRLVVFTPRGSKWILLSAARRPSAVGLPDPKLSIELFHTIPTIFGPSLVVAYYNSSCRPPRVRRYLMLNPAGMKDCSRGH